MTTCVCAGIRWDSRRICAAAICQEEASAPFTAEHAPNWNRRNVVGWIGALEFPAADFSLRPRCRSIRRRQVGLPANSIRQSRREAAGFCWIKPLELRVRGEFYAGMKPHRAYLALAFLAGAAVCGLFAAEPQFISLFAQDGAPKGWVVRAWDDVRNPAKGDPVWKVEKGVLHGGEPRGSWLLSEKEYGDFELEFEFKLGEMGNSGCALRAPLQGDPAFDGMELQMADFRYNTKPRIPS